MAATALAVITLIEKLEPEVQIAVVDLINLWKGNPQAVKITLQGEVTALNTIAAKARAEQGLPPLPPIPDPDPTPSSPAPPTP